MSPPNKPRTLSSAQLAELEILPAGVVDLRRDLYQFVRYVQDKGLVRTKRENAIPKSTARRLAKLLSYSQEAEAVEEDGCGFWSDQISRLARELRLVAFDTKGIYQGYSSSAPSFPDNAITVDKNAWQAYLSQTALQKERAILEAQLRMTGNEFFHAATLVGGDRFDTFGRATGPAGAMVLPRVRQGLLKLLAGLEPDRWYATRGVVELLQQSAPHLILDPQTREPDAASQRQLREWEFERRRGTRGKHKGNKPQTKPEVALEDIYTNFRERAVTGKQIDYRSKRQISSMTQDAFFRVEGRYLEFFLSEIPYRCGFVELATRRPGDPCGLDVSPAFERLPAFRLLPRFFQVMREDAELDRVKLTVLPTFEVLVEAPSYPEQILDTLEPYTTLVREDGPIHRLRLEQRKVVQVAALDPEARPLAAVLEDLARSPLPENVAAELGCWSRHGEKVVFYEGFGLLELVGAADQRKAVLGSLGALVQEDGPAGFAIVRDPSRAFGRLEDELHVPLRVKHRAMAFVSCAGRLSAAGRAPAAAARPARPAPARVQEVRLESEDLVGYRASSTALLTALHEALRAEARTCLLVDGDLLVLSAAALPLLRATLRRLSGRFDVTSEAAPVGSGHRA